MRDVPEAGSRRGRIPVDRDEATVRRHEDVGGRDVLVDDHVRRGPRKALKPLHPLGRHKAREGVVHLPHEGADALGVQRRVWRARVVGTQALDPLHEVASVRIPAKAAWRPPESHCFEVLEQRVSRGAVGVRCLHGDCLSVDGSGAYGNVERPRRTGDARGGAVVASAVLAGDHPSKPVEVVEQPNSASSLL